MKIRNTVPGDVPALIDVLNQTGLFPGELLPEMLEGFFSRADNPDVWLTCEIDGHAIGFCFAAPEDMTEGTWNMLAIAVLPDRQGSGAGSAIVKALEKRLRGDGQRVLIADTSGTDEFQLTRSFYRKNGYTKEARIRDFWAAGDDKIVFWKSLT